MKKKLNIVVVGARGRMGREVIKVVSKDNSLKLSATIDNDKKFELKNLRKINADVVIDFSIPQGAVEAAFWCAQLKIPLVTGTTGLNKKQELQIRRASKKTAILVSPNMSVGVNALVEALKAFCKKFGRCRVEIEETHHIHKRDKPSGTARFLEKVVRGEISKGSVVKKPKSLRRGEILGVHKVNFISESERVCFQHTATDRSLFARGAIKAAKWLVGRNPGMYSLGNLGPSD